MNNNQPATAAPANETPLKDYRVVITTWDVHKTVIQARDELEAAAKAEALWNDDPDAFKCGDCGVDGITAEEIRS